MRHLSLFVALKFGTRGIETNSSWHAGCHDRQFLGVVCRHGQYPRWRYCVGRRRKSVWLGVGVGLLCCALYFYWLWLITPETGRFKNIFINQ